MHARELVEVAGLVALNGPLFVAAEPAGGSAYLDQYWATSRCRLESWHRAMRCHASLAPENTRDDSDRWV
jgi:hypothetical protein